MTSSNNSNDGSTPPIILLHNKELLSTSFKDTFATDQWSTTTDVNRTVSTAIPTCSNVLFPPAVHDDDGLSLDEKKQKKEQQRPENIFDWVDPMIYGTYQCRIFPNSPYDDLVEQFVFVYTCATGSTRNVVAATVSNNSSSSGSHTTNDITNVTSMHLLNAVTTCLSAENTNDMDDESPPSITSISMSMQRLCRNSNSSTDGSDLMVLFQPQPGISSNNTAMSSPSSTSSSYLCRACDGSILDHIYHNTSAATNSTNHFEYCTSTLDVDPFTRGNSRIVASDIQLWCGPNDGYDTDDAALIEYCTDIRNSTTYNFYEYVIPNVTMIDTIQLPSTGRVDDASNQCSFDSLLSSFVAASPLSGTIATPNYNNDIVLPTISIFGHAHYSNDSNNNTTLTAYSTVLAMNLRDILLDLLTRQQQ